MKHVLSILSGVFALLALGGCAGTVYAPPTAVAEPEAVAALRASAVETKLGRRARMQDLAWPLRMANAELCSKVAPASGLALADPELLSDMIGGLTKEQLRALGEPDGVQVLHAAAGSPAAAAGLRRGQVIVSLNGEALAADTRAGALSRKIVSILKEEKPVRLGWQTDGDSGEAIVEGEAACAVTLRLSTAAEANAYATFDEIILNTGLMKEASDAELQFVIAHELGHVAAQHSRKLSRNYLVSGAAVYRPLLGAAGGLADTLLQGAGVHRTGSLKARGLAVAAPWQPEFEAEADYLGLYMFARAGGDVTQADNIYRQFATESPGGTWLRYSHPLYQDRLAAYQATLAEIRQKQAAGEALLPERKRGRE